MIRPVTMLAGVAVVLAILVAPYLRPWMAQQSQIKEKAAQADALQQRVDALTAERARWNDPNYVKAQARTRLNFVMPGELGYVVLPDGTRSGRPADPARQAAADAGTFTGRPWYGVVWESLQLAGEPSAVSAPATGSAGAPATGSAGVP